MEKYVSLLLAAAITLTTASCGKRNITTDTSSEYIGYWECTTLVLDGEDAGEYFPNTKLPIYTFYNLTLGNDGKGFLSSPMGDYINSISGSGDDTTQLLTWESDETGVTLKGETDDDVIKLDSVDGKLMMNRNDDTHTVEVYFSRVDAFTVFDFPKN